MKYRIVRNGLGKYAAEEWVPGRICGGDWVLMEGRYNSKAEAEQAAEQWITDIEEARLREIKRNTWEVV